MNIRHSRSLKLRLRRSFRSREMRLVFLEVLLSTRMHTHILIDFKWWQRWNRNLSCNDLRGTCLNSWGRNACTSSNSMISKSKSTNKQLKPWAWRPKNSYPRTQTIKKQMTHINTQENQLKTLFKDNMIIHMNKSLKNINLCFIKL